MNIVTATVTEDTSALGGPYERRPMEIFGIVNRISCNSLLGSFWGR